MEWRTGDHIARSIDNEGAIGPAGVLARHGERGQRHPDAGPRGGIADRREHLVLRFPERWRAMPVRGRDRSGRTGPGEQHGRAACLGSADGGDNRCRIRLR